MTTQSLTYSPSLIRRMLLATLWAVAFMAVLYLVAFEQGALTNGAPVLHEAFHDARHLLGFPCH